MSKKKIARKPRYVVVTTDKDRRGVFFGELVSETNNGSVVELQNAQMAVYWSAKTRGVLGLASIGPQEGSRITPVISSIKVNGVTSIMDATEEAVQLWQKQPWD